MFGNRRFCRRESDVLVNAARKGSEFVSSKWLNARSIPSCGRTDRSIVEPHTARAGGHSRSRPGGVKCWPWQVRGYINVSRIRGVRINQTTDFPSLPPSECTGLYCIHPLVVLGGTIKQLVRQRKKRNSSIVGSRVGRGRVTSSPGPSMSPSSSRVVIKPALEARHSKGIEQTVW